MLHYSRYLSNYSIGEMKKIWKEMKKIWKGTDDNGKRKGTVGRHGSRYQGKVIIVCIYKGRSSCEPGVQGKLMMLTTVPLPTYQGHGCPIKPVQDQKLQDSDTHPHPHPHPLT
jgi:hypothetical protein